jgi:hypothetical protein
MNSDFQAIDLNTMETVTGGGAASAIWKGVKAGGQFVKKNWQGIVSAADLAYSAARDFFGGKKE